jgi:hypothetical protein
MTKTLKSYKEVSEDSKLDKVTAARFIAYMTKRWIVDEEIQCVSGYAHEWAERFAWEAEYAKSDFAGVKVLQSIDTCENCHEPLTYEELLEAVGNGLTLGEVCCDKCYGEFLSQKCSEHKHPDE